MKWWRIQYTPGVSPALGMEKWARRYVVKMHNLWDLFLACGGVTGPGYQNVLNFTQTSIHEVLFNPHSSFGRSFLKLPICTRTNFIASSLAQNSLFLLRVIQPRAWPLLKSKKKKIPTSTPPPIKFFPPLYLPPPIPLPQQFSSPISLSIHNTPSYHLLNFVRLSFFPPRQGIG